MTTVADLKVKFSADQGNVQGVIRQVDRGLKDLAGGAGRTRDGLGSLFSVAGGNLLASGISTATRAVVGMGRAFVGVVGSSIQMSTDLNAQISTISALAGATAGEAAQIKGLINALGIDPNLKVTSAEAADAIQMLIKNGLEVPEVLDGAARSTVLLSNATGANFTTSADVATSAMQAFGINAKDMGQAVNGIVSVVTNSKLDIDDYRLAISQAGGVAAASGVEFDDFNTMLASTAYMFGSGSDQGTAFKTFLSTLIPQSKQAAKAMTQLGLVTADGTNLFFDSTGALKDQAEIAGLLNEAFRDLTEQQQIDAMTTIFGADGKRAATAIMQQTTQQVLDYKKALAQTDAEKIAAEKMNNLAGDMEIFSGTVEALQTQWADGMEPSLRKVFQSITPLVAELTPKIVAMSKSFTDAFIVPAVDGFVAKLREAHRLSDLAFTVTGDSTSSFLAGLAELTGGTTVINAEAKIVTVDWGAGLFTYTYNATANITEQSVLWGAWTHVYDAKAQIEGTSVLWGGYTHVYDAKAQVDGASVGWGAWTHTYDAKAGVGGEDVLWGAYTHVYDAQAEIKKDSILWGAFTLERDATGKITSFYIGEGVEVPTVTTTGVINQFEVTNTPTVPVNVKSEPGMWSTFWRGFDAGIVPISWDHIFGFSQNEKIDFDITQVNWVDVFNFELEWSPSVPQRLTWDNVFNFSLDWFPSIHWPNPPAWLSWLTGGGGGGSGQPDTRNAAQGNTHNFNRNPGRNAEGTPHWRGGLTWVGERGPELVSLPAGSRIYNNRESAGLAGAGAGAGDIYVTINATVSNGLDIQQLAYQVADVMRRRR